MNSASYSIEALNFSDQKKQNTKNNMFRNYEAHPATKYWIPKLKKQNARFVNILCCWSGVSLARVDARRVDASRQVATSLTTQDVNQDLSHL